MPSYSIRADYQQQNWLDYVIHICAFLSFLLIGTDTLGFSLFNVNIRYCQFILVILTMLLLIKIKFNLPCILSGKHKDVKFWLIVVFIACGLISSLVSAYTSRAILFWFFIVYNVIFLLFGIGVYVYLYKDFAFKLFRISSFVVVWLLVVQMVLWLSYRIEIPFMCNKQYYNNIYRFSLWAYEPSYFATYLLLWLGYASVQLCCNEKKEYILDILCSVLAIVITTSTSGFVGIALIFCVVYAIWLYKKFKWQKLLFLLIPVVFILIFRFALPGIWETFVMRLFDRSLDEASGGRISAWKTAFNVFIKNFFFGVGPGCFGLYVADSNLITASNVTLELLSTLGIFATLAYITFHVVLLVQALMIYVKHKEDKDAITILSLAVALFCFIIVLQVNQGYLRLYHWLFLAFLSGKINNYQGDNLKEFRSNRHVSKKE